MAPGERGGGRVQRSTRASSQTNQSEDTVWLQAQGRVASTRARPPLVAAPSLCPVQCCRCFYRNAWSKRSDAESARARGPAFTGKRLRGESTANLSAHGGPCVPLAATRQRSYPHAARKWYRQRAGFLSTPSGPSKDGFREPCPEREPGRGQRRVPSW